MSSYEIVQIANKDITEAAKKALERPSHFIYYGDNKEMFVRYGTSGIGQNRDSEAIERSNFRVIHKDLIKRFPDDVMIERASHWLCGWVESIKVRILKPEANPDNFTKDDITDVFKACLEWHEKLSKYPIADEGDWSDEETEEWHETLQHSYGVPADIVGDVAGYLSNRLNCNGPEDTVYVCERRGLKMNDVIKQAIAAVSKDPSIRAAVRRVRYAKRTGNIWRKIARTPRSRRSEYIPRYRVEFENGLSERLQDAREEIGA